MQVVAIEKNLASLGYFTPSSKRVRGQGPKTVSFAKTIDGSRVRAKATIVPAVGFGLPTTSDQDKYIAFQKIVGDLKRRDGEVRNPIGFTSAELLELLGQSRNSGKNYEHVSEWLDVMTTTTIISEGLVTVAGRNIWSKDRFRVFNRAVSFNGELGEGKRADQNYVWLSQWQLENINANHLFPIELERYLKLKNHVSKALVPHLHIWLFASRKTGVFEKRYSELCQVLHLRWYPQISKIKEKLKPSLDELVSHGYISKWDVCRTAEKNTYKVVFTIRCDQEKAASSDLSLQSRKTKQELDPNVLLEMVKRGIPERRAKLLLANTSADQVLDQLEWGDHLIAQNSGSKIKNPTGFYIYLIIENIRPPEHFETSSKKSLFAEQTREYEQQMQRQSMLELAYDKYRNRVIDEYIARDYPGAEYEAQVKRKKQELSTQYHQFAYWKPEAVRKFLDNVVRSSFEKEVPLVTFESFSQRGLIPKT